jgi:hypothetical protein
MFIVFENDCLGPGRTKCLWYSKMIAWVPEGPNVYSYGSPFTSALQRSAMYPMQGPHPAPLEPHRSEGEGYKHLVPPGPKQCSSKHWIRYRRSPKKQLISDVRVLWDKPAVCRVTSEW